MTTTRRARALLLLACVPTFACSKDEDRDKPVKIIELPTRYTHEATPIPPPPDAAPTAAPERPLPWPRTAEATPAVPGSTSSSTLLPRSTLPQAAVADAAPAKPVDPDEAIRESLRVGAGGCFGGLPTGGANPPERSAHLTVTVIPTGTVSRADVSSDDTTNPGVLSCLRQRAQSTVFSDNHGGPLRTYEIDVRVVAADRGQVH